MKKYIIMFICVLLALPYWVFAQDIESVKDTTLVAGVEDTQSTIICDGVPYSFNFVWEKKKHKATKSHWSGFGFAFTDLDNLDNNVLKRSKSYSMSLNLIDFTTPLHPHWLLVSGLGFDWTRYHFKGNIGLEEVDGYTQFVPAQDGKEYKSSKLMVTYLTIPILLEYQTKLRRNSTFFINGGLEAAIRTYSKSQVDIRRDKKVDKTTLGRDLNIRPKGLRIRAQIGIDDISIFGYYQLNSFFENGEGLELHPYALGMSLNF